MSRIKKHNVKSLIFYLVLIFFSFYVPVFLLLWIRVAIFAGEFWLDFVCVDELSVFLASLEASVEGKGLDFGFLLLLSSCGAIGGDIEGGMLVRNSLSLLVFMCAI